MKTEDAIDEQMTPTGPGQGHSKGTPWLAGLGAIVVVALVIGASAIVFAQLGQHHKSQSPNPSIPPGKWVQVLNGYSLASLAAGDSNPSVLYACAVHSQTSTPQAVTGNDTSYTILRSTDFGGQWQDIGSNAALGSSCQLAVNPGNSNELYAIGLPNAAQATSVLKHSTDGGQTWNHEQAIPGSVFTQFAQSTDKNSTTADPTRPGTAYTVWDTLIEPTDNPDDNPHTSSYTGPAYFSKTTDGGQTWSQARVIIDTKTRTQTIGNIIVVDPRNGDLYNFTDLIVSPNTPRQGTRSNAQLAFVKSTDGGDHWTQPQIIAPFNSLGVRDPNTREPLRVGDGLEEVAVGSNGKIYVVWESSTNYQKQLKQSTGAWDDEILITTSVDGGATWTAPSVVHKLASGLPTFTPTVAVNGSTVAVTYYDNRNLTPGQTANLPTDYFVKYSTDGGATFGSEQRITPTSFDSRTAPVARGFFLGDYEGLQPMGTGFAAMFVKTNCDSTDALGQVFPSGGACAPASSTSGATSNTNPTDAFFVTFSL